MEFPSPAEPSTSLYIVLATSFLALDLLLWLYPNAFRSLLLLFYIMSPVLVQLQISNNQVLSSQFSHSQMAHIPMLE